MSLFDLLFGRRRAPAIDTLEVVEDRWRRRNAEARAAGCHCGGPAEEVRYDHRNIGRVPVEFWTCREHVGVEVWMGRQPQWSHATPCPLGKTTSTMGKIGHPPDTFHCPHRTHEDAP